MNADEIQAIQITKPVIKLPSGRQVVVACTNPIKFEYKLKDIPELLAWGKTQGDWYFEVVCGIIYGQPYF